MQTELAPGIWEIANFYSKEEISDQILAASQSTVWGHAKVGKYNHDTAGVDEIVDPMHRCARVLSAEHIPEQCAHFEIAVDNVCIPAVKRIWNLDNLRIVGTQFVRYDTGGMFNLHRDWGKAFRDRCVSIIVYLNDNFSGGELVFSEINYEYRPKVSSCLLFPSEYLHSSLPIKEGQKSILLTFLCAK